MSHNRYGLFFLLVAVVAVYWAISARYVSVCVLMCWLAISCVWVTAAFFLHRPEMLMGKRPNGGVFLPFCVVNFPFLAIYWFTWVIRHFLIRHEAVNRVTGTNISISCWPCFHVPVRDYDLVIDVTSEMPKCYKADDARYVCLPNLDGVPLDRHELPVDINRETRVLVHCAQGRGRSALVVCLLLLKLGYVQTADQALQTLRQSRPTVSLSQRQFTQLAYFSENEIL